MYLFHSERSLQRFSITLTHTRAQRWYLISIDLCGAFRCPRAIGRVIKISRVATFTLIINNLRIHLNSFLMLLELPHDIKFIFFIVLGSRDFITQIADNEKWDFLSFPRDQSFKESSTLRGLI